jgi:tRNA A37 methylthiotransferase MiaB
MRFERLGVFQYSHEESTRAHTLEDDISATELKEERAAELNGYTRANFARTQQTKNRQNVIAYFSTEKKATTL